jgi:hypothetical protein
LWSRYEINAQSFASHEVDITDHAMGWKRREIIWPRRLGWLSGLHSHTGTDEGEQENS